MDTKRQGEIALLYLKDKLQSDGLKIQPDMRRQVLATARKLGISPEEAIEFAEILVRDFVEKGLAKLKQEKD
ncbi:MAG: hypothetical protein WAW90_00540 [Minisyncoccia bacterium]